MHLALARGARRTVIYCNSVPFLRMIYCLIW